MFISRTSSIILLCMLSYFCRSQEIYKPKFYSDPFLNNSLPFKKWKSLKGNIKSVETKWWVTESRSLSHKFYFDENHQLIRLDENSSSHKNETKTIAIIYDENDHPVSKNTFKISTINGDTIKKIRNLYKYDRFGKILYKNEDGSVKKYEYNMIGDLVEVYRGYDSFYNENPIVFNLYENRTYDNTTGKIQSIIKYPFNNSNLDNWERKELFTYNHFDKLSKHTIIKRDIGNEIIKKVDTLTFLYEYNENFKLEKEYFNGVLSKEYKYFDNPGFGRVKEEILHRISQKRIFNEKGDVVYKNIRGYETFTTYTFNTSGKLTEKKSILSSGDEPFGDVIKYNNKNEVIEHTRYSSSHKITDYLQDGLIYKTVQVRNDITIESDYTYDENQNVTKMISKSSDGKETIQEWKYEYFNN